MKLAISQHKWCAESYDRHSSPQNDAAIKLLQSLTLNGNESVLDIGCGNGKISAILADDLSCGTVLGIDLSPEMIEFARTTFSQTKHANLEFKLQNAEHIAYDNIFDIVFSSFALQWITNHRKMFELIKKSLKINGRLVVTVPLDISLVLEQTISTVILEPEWAQHFQNYTPGWHFLTSLEYAHLLINSNLKISKFTIVRQETYFSSREEFKAYVSQWLSYKNALPENLRERFLNQIIEKYIQSGLILESGEIRFDFLRLDFVATKIIP